MMNTTLQDDGSRSLSSYAGRTFAERTPGVDISVLRAHPDGGLTFLVRMREGARAERHGHPGGEETYVLFGKMRIDRRVNAANEPQPDATLAAGDYFFAPVGEVHEGLALEDTIFLVIAPGGLARV